MNNNNTKIKLAWQAAFEQRTCPPEAILFAETVDNRLNAHLAVCHLCREKRDMPLAEREAWQQLREKFRGSVMQPGLPPKVGGQVWMLAGTLAGWSEDNHYYSPPTVVLLEKTEGTSGWRVAQLHGDKCLMGSGDVALDDKYGFAQGWNCYTLHEKNFEQCLGVVKEDNFTQILEASVSRYELAEEESILSFFRKLEIEVGAYVAVPSVMGLVSEWEMAHAAVTVNVWLENMFGSFADVFKKLTDLEIPSIADTVSDLLSGVRVGGLATNLSMASSLTTLSVNIVNKKIDGEIGIKTIGASITEDDWQDSTYFIAGKLDDEFTAGLHLLAWLTFENKQIGECINQMTGNSPYFDIVFRDVPKEACTLENVKFLLVSP